jgi:hypothetical protein
VKSSPIAFSSSGAVVVKGTITRAEAAEAAAIASVDQGASVALTTRAKEVSAARKIAAGPVARAERVPKARAVTVLRGGFTTGAPAVKVVTLNTVPVLAAGVVAAVAATTVAAEEAVAAAAILAAALLAVAAVDRPTLNRVPPKHAYGAAGKTRPAMVSSFLVGRDEDIYV